MHFTPRSLEGSTGRPSQGSPSPRSNRGVRIVQTSRARPEEVSLQEELDLARRLAVEAQETLQAYASELQHERAALVAALEKTGAQAQLWEFRYLGKFLDAGTHDALRVIGASTGMTIYAVAKTVVSADARTKLQLKRRATVASALIEARLVSQHENGLLTVTRKGTEFLNWLGTAA